MAKRMWQVLSSVAALLLILAGLLGVAFPQKAVAGPERVDPELLARLEREGQGTFLVYLAEQADLTPAYRIRDWNERGRFVYRALREVADRTQPIVVGALEGLRTTGHVTHYHRYYIVNLILVRGDATAARALARLPQVAAVYPEMRIELIRPVEGQPASSIPQTVEWNIQKINADDVWSVYGVTGAGAVVANIDTGVAYEHPALVGHYRGNLGGGAFDHNYNWFDPTFSYPYPYPIEGDHGTHTMGTMIGDDGAGNQIGVAPGAQWIAAYGCCPDNETLLSATEWMIAPTDLSGHNPDPDKRPHVVNNSWGGPGGSLIFNQLLEAQRAAGIFPAFSAGNSGSGCGTLGSPGDNPAAFNTGATDANDNIAAFSSRGPDPFHSWFGLYGIGPEITAPGVGVRSSIPGGGYAYYSGTSMASPHTAGAVALLYSAEPALIGRLDEVEELLRRTAVPRTTTQQCGGVPGSVVPNNTYGWGRLDVKAAVDLIWHAGTLAGTITDAVSGDPVAATVLMQRNGYTLSTQSGPDGSYEFLLGEGNYTVTILAYGYEPWTQAGVAIAQDVTTTLDVALTPVPVHTLSGTVLEGATEVLGEPVAARVGLRFTDVDVATDPATGAYSTPVAEGLYWMRVVARGYVPEDRIITATSDITENVSLLPRATYYVRDSRSPCGPAFNWIDARDGTPHYVGDDAFFALPLGGRTFRFYGNPYTSIFVSSNGLISFGQGYARGHMVFPFEGPPNNAVYGFEEDLNPANGAQGIIYHKFIGDRYLVVEFYQVEHWEHGYPETFEFILDFQTGAILVQYLEVSWPDFASVGIENQDGSDGILYSYANSAGITNSLAVGFYPVVGAPPADQDPLGVYGTLSGTVTISETGAPAAGAVVTATTFLRTLTTTADIDGHYLFPDVCADLYWLQGQLPGYPAGGIVPVRLRWSGDVAEADLVVHGPPPVTRFVVYLPVILRGR
jgi:subtilisin family serine protease